MHAVIIVQVGSNGKALEAAKREEEARDEYSLGCANRLYVSRRLRCNTDYCCGCHSLQDANARMLAADVCASVSPSLVCVYFILSDNLMVFPLFAISFPLSSASLFSAFFSLSLLLVSCHLSRSHSLLRSFSTPFLGASLDTCLEVRQTGLTWLCIQSNVSLGKGNRCGSGV